MERGPQVKMSVEMFRSIIDEIASWVVHPNFVCPFLTNEPFADPRIYEFCEYINLKLPKTKIAFYTNGSLFTEGNLKKLDAIANIDVIHVSWHHGNKADYEKDLGLNFERSIESVHRLINHRKWTIRIARVQDGNRAKDAEFLEFSKRVFGAVNAMLCGRYNWKGDIASPWKYEGTLDIYCPRHNTMSILADGRVALCCMDQKGEYSLGEALKTPLLYIFNSPKTISYRDRTKRHSDPCNRCNMI